MSEGCPICHAEVRTCLSCLHEASNTLPLSLNSARLRAGDWKPVGHRTYSPQVMGLTMGPINLINHSYHSPTPSPNVYGRPGAHPPGPAVCAPV